MAHNGLYLTTCSRRIRIFEVQQYMNIEEESKKSQSFNKNFPKIFHALSIDINTPPIETQVYLVSVYRTHTYLSASKYTSVRNRRVVRRLKSKYRFDLPPGRVTRERVYRLYTPLR